MLEMEKVAKLPKWAQDHIRYLNMRVSELTDTVLRLSEPESISETDTVVHDYHNPDQRLSKGAIIRFDVNGAEIDVSVRNDVLEIRVNNGMLNVAPRVSNVIEITGVLR